MTSINSELEQFIWNLVPQSPLFLVWIIGFIIALVRWRRHPMPSLFTVLAMAMYTLSAIFFAAVYAWLPTFTRSNPYVISNAFQRTQQLYQAIHVVYVSVSAVATALLLIAAMFWRKPHQSPTGFPVGRAAPPPIVAPVQQS